jgi:hypothetical protein
MRNLTISGKIASQPLVITKSSNALLLLTVKTKSCYIELNYPYNASCLGNWSQYANFTKLTSSSRDFVINAEIFDSKDEITGFYDNLKH